MEKDFLSKVYGYKRIKEELYLIRNWYLNSDKLKEKRELLPKGILLYGEPGNGKTRIIREYSKTFNYPIFVIEGKNDNVQKEVCDIYEQAKKEKHAIVVIDELDRLIDKDDKLIRIIMSQLDGFDANTNILTLATCNEYYKMPDALIREGRFDRHFYIGITDGEMEDIIRSFSTDAKIILTEEEILELSQCLNYYSTGEIKAIFNNASLRYGDDCTIDNIINTADFLKTGYIGLDKKTKIDKYIAVHEAGHAIYSYFFCDSQRFLRIYFNDEGGCTISKDIDSKETIESRINKVRMSLAGIVAEELIFKKHSIGCSNDLEKAHNFAFRLMNRACIEGLDSFCSRETYYDRRNISEYSSKIIDKKTNKFLKDNYKIVKRNLKKYKKHILLVSDYLQEHREIKRNDFIKLLSTQI